MATVSEVFLTRSRTSLLSDREPLEDFDGNSAASVILSLSGGSNAGSRRHSLASAGSRRGSGASSGSPVSQPEEDALPQIHKEASDPDVRDPSVQNGDDEIQEDDPDDRNVQEAGTKLLSLQEWLEGGGSEDSEEYDTDLEEDFPPGEYSYWTCINRPFLCSKSRLIILKKYLN